jgi:hypothetical protein
MRKKEIHKKDGTIIIRPRLTSKYWHRIKMKFKKEHQLYCACYWCLKKKFGTNIPCPSCGRNLKSFGWHVNKGMNNHDSGFGYQCKCGFRKKMTNKKKIILTYNNAHPGQIFLMHQDSDHPLMKRKRELEELGYEVELKGVFKGFTHTLDKMGLTDKLMKCSKEELEEILKSI